MKRFSGKTVLVTGSSRGIGFTIAKEFAKEGAAIILHASKLSPHATGGEKDIKKYSPNSKLFTFDVSSPQEVQRAFALILNRFPHVDILVNNAGVVENVLFEKMTFTQWNRVIQTNLYGAYHVTKFVLPMMIKERWGRVINLSSISALRGEYGQVNYSASKAGLIGFTASLAKEVARYNITVNAICPGLVDTDILKDVAKEYMDSLLKQIPLRRVAHPIEIASLVLYLSGQESGYITGEHINITGGWR